jgi:transposase
MRGEGRLWARLLGVERAVVEAVELDEGEDALVCHVRAWKRERGRCGECGRRCPGYDSGEGRRRWRALDLGTVRAYLEADAPRVKCPVHGVIVAAVPWARHRAGHTRAFDDQVAWLAVATSKSAVCALMRIAWRTAGSVVTRVCADVDAVTDRFAGLRRIGIDEISFRKGRKYLIVVVDHDSGRLVWAAEGRSEKALGKFFTALGEDRCKLITHVSADSADWIGRAVTRACPGAVRCADPFHVVKWAGEALDEVRRQFWRAARKTGPSRGRGKGRRDSAGTARDLRNARYALWKNPEDLTTNQKAKLDWIAKTHPYLYRAWLLKEALRYVFKVKGTHGMIALSKWLAWARRCRIPEFAALAVKIRRHRDQIYAALDCGLSNGLIESTNTKIRLITRIAYGFKDPAALIALAMLTLGGYRPPLPGRKPS